MNHIFGPVNSRRLGRSLGIDLFRYKICNLNCIYCEAGPNVTTTCKRKSYTPPNVILEELATFMRDTHKSSEIDTITVTAAGEPTLHADLGFLITELKKMTGKTIAVLTNGTTLNDEEVRKDLSHADLVIPSLDAAIDKSFRKINRPAIGLNLRDIISGLNLFCQEFCGQIWLEILFANGINDHNEDISALIQALWPIKLKRIQINTVARPPLEQFAHPLSAERLRAIASQFSTLPCSPLVELLSIGQKDCTPSPYNSSANQEHTTDHRALLVRIIDTLQRRPCTANDINRIFHLDNTDKVDQLLEPLVLSGKLKRQAHHGTLYYQIG
ncbi:MAG: radical SAM protein [Desulfobulbaceae bacterium]|nr:radical SAM protein [Desulfobulbaceae bacterium]